MIENIIIAAFSGVIFLVLGFWLNVLYHRKKEKKSGLIGDAHNIVQELKLNTEEFKGCCYVTKTGKDNFDIASHVYKRAMGTVIGTCFRENPANYGLRDLAQRLPKNTEFYRITTRYKCDIESENIVVESMKKLVTGKVIVIEDDDLLTKIDGIFCKLLDETYLAFVTFGGTEPLSNRGVLFYGNVAKPFFEYYFSFCK